MEQPSSATFYAQSDIWTAINRILDLPGNLRVASPYISDKVQFEWRSGDSLLIALSESNVKKGFVNPYAVEKLIDKGVKVYSNEKLHAKIYSKDKQAIICSCNLSYASQKEWLEAGVWLNDTANLEKVDLLFNENMNESNLISKERLIQLRDLFETGINETTGQITTVDFSENVWSVSLIEGKKLSENLQNKVQTFINETEKDKSNYSYYHFRTNKSEFKVGDYIIQFKTVRGSMKIFFPARCIKITTITDDLFIVHLRHKGIYQPLEWADFESAFSDLDLTPTHKEIELKSQVIQRLYLYFNND